VVPRWALICTIVGGLLMTGSGISLAATEILRERYTGAINQTDIFGELNPGGEEGSDITGPLNIILAGLDTRPSRPNEVPRADTVMLVHIPEGLDRAYLFSLPRDTLVDIPPFEETGYLGQQQVKLNGAMAEGAVQINGEELPNVERGFSLLARTVSDYTGIEPFDAGAIITFTGFRDVVDAMGGVTMVLDQRIVSEHRQPDGKHRPVNPDGNGYYGPQMVYEPGEQHLSGWQALDVVRQRYGIEGGDYGRAKNQQKFLKAIVEQALSRDMLTDPLAMDRVLRSAGEALTFFGRGHDVLDFAFALKGLRPSSMVMVSLPGDSVFDADGDASTYDGERLQEVALEFFDAVREEQVDAFVLAHPELVSQF
jgi:LCP family protein required for cell wall assembly